MGKITRMFWRLILKKAAARNVGLLIWQAYYHLSDGLRKLGSQPIFRSLMDNQGFAMIPGGGNVYIYIKGILKSWSKIAPEIKRRILAHVSQERSQSPLMQWVLRRSEQIISAQRIDSDQIREIVMDLIRKGYHVLPFPKRINGGGRGSRGLTKIDFSRSDLIGFVLKRIGLYRETINLDPIKRINRIGLLFKTVTKFESMPMVKYGMPKNMPYFPGMIFGRPKWMQKNGLPIGAKMGFICKSTLWPCQELEGTGIDVLVPEPENKFGIRDPKKFGSLLRWRPERSPIAVFSKNLLNNKGKLGRLPSAKWDLISLIGENPKKDKKIEKLRNIYEHGNISVKDIEAMFGYEMDGSIKLRPVGQKILAGMSIFHPDIWPEFRKVFFKFIEGSLFRRIKGIYGQVNSLEILKSLRLKYRIRKGWFVRFPWTTPIYSNYAVYGSIIFIPHNLLELFGGDEDGDQGAIYFLRWNGPEWPKDKKWLQDHMKLPEKKNFSGKISEAKALIKIVEHYRSCGSVYNDGMIAIDTARASGIKGRDLLGLQMRILSEEVQPHIDGLKYSSAEKTPDLEYFCKKYHLDLELARKIEPAFAALRRFKDLERIPDIKEAGKSFYLKISQSLKWKKGDFVESPALDSKTRSIVKNSFVLLGPDPAARWNYIRHQVDADLKLICRDAFERRDIQFARYLAEIIYTKEKEVMQNESS